MQKLVKKELLSFDWLDHYELAHGPTVLELDAPADLGEKSVIFAAPNVQAGLHPRATLAHDDGASGDQLSAECFKPQPLRVRVAPVS